MTEEFPEIKITDGPVSGFYNIFALASKDTVTTTAQGLLAIARWVELHRDELRKESGQEIIQYRVELWKSKVVRSSSIVDFPVDAINAQEAVSRALRQYGAKEMKIVFVTSAAKKETFYNVELQDDGSITFSSSQEDLRPQPPFAPPFDPQQPLRPHQGETKNENTKG